METLPNGTVTIINLPGTTSLLQRSWYIYKHLFGKLLHLTILFLIGFLVNALVVGFLELSVKGGNEVYRGFIQILNGGISIVTGLYYAFIFSAMVYMIKDWTEGVSISILESFEKAKGRFISVVYSAILYALVVFGVLFVTLLIPAFFANSSSLAASSLAFYAIILSVILPTLFSIWFYFGIYASILEDYRGVESLARSQYLTHGLFFKILGRYLAFPVLLIIPYFLVYFRLAVPLIGWAVFLLAAVALTILVSPFYIIYEILRYEDLMAVNRNVKFHMTNGMKAHVMTWAIIGLLFIGFSTYEGLLDEQTKVQLGEASAKFSLPFFVHIKKNTEILSEYLKKLNISIPAIEHTSMTPSSDTPIQGGNYPDQYLGQ